MKTRKVLSVVGARPNFMKLAPVHRELAREGRADHVIVHTGQHYDRSMSESFFGDLGIPLADENLGVGSGTHAQQTGMIMQRLEPVLLERRPDVVLVYGDVNSTVAAALVAAKLRIPVGHVEAGLRSRDWDMPEEINRVVTDRVADLLFTPSHDADENLLAEGIVPERIRRVGNVMIDSLVHALPAARASRPYERYGVRPGQYVVATLHRPANVDVPETLATLLSALAEIARGRPVLFPVHPRTRGRIDALTGAWGQTAGLRLLGPLPYVEMLGLVDGAELVITDSGGLQEETSFLGVPCLTVRPNTERPITCTMGTNRLVTPEREALLREMDLAPERRQVGGKPIPGWDGMTGRRIVAELARA